MSQTYISKKGDTVDYICFKQYGNTNAGVVEAVFASNYGLADYGVSLPYGIEILLPVIATPKNDEVVSLWD